MSAQPRVTNAWWMSSRTSQRVRRRRNQWSSAIAPSTTCGTCPGQSRAWCRAGLGAGWSGIGGPWPVDLVVIAAVGVQVLGAAQWGAALAVDRRGGLDQRDQLGGVVAVAAGSDRGDRDAMCLDDQVVLAVGLVPVHRGRTRWPARPSSRGCGWSRTWRGEVQQVCGPQLGEQKFVQALPNPGLVPLPQPSPAGDPRAVAQLLGQTLPSDPGVQHEQDPAQLLRLSRR
jgi:hypothetical protein